MERSAFDVANMVLHALAGPRVVLADALPGLPANAVCMPSTDRLGSGSNLNSAQHPTTARYMWEVRVQPPRP